MIKQQTSDLIVRPCDQDWLVAGWRSLAASVSSACLKGEGALAVTALLNTQEFHFRFWY